MPSNFDPTWPTGLVNLDVDYQQGNKNSTQLDTTFGIDHYKYSDQTANNGKHNSVTTPLIVGSAHPVTAAAEPKFYAMQDSANVGVIQYSRGPSSAVPSPVTTLQSPAAGIVVIAGGTTNVLDFTGLARAVCMLYASSLPASPVIAPNYTASVAYNLSWNGTIFILPANQPLIGITNTGNILQLKSNGGTGTIFWTLQMLRLQ